MCSQPEESCWATEVLDTAAAGRDFSSLGRQLAKVPDNRGGLPLMRPTSASAAATPLVIPHFVFGSYRGHFGLGPGVGERRHALRGDRVLLAVAQQPLLPIPIGLDVVGHRPFAVPTADALRSNPLQQTDLRRAGAGGACPDSSCLDHRHLDAALG